MTTYVPRPPYSEDELGQLYPADLRLKHVQVILRHGERTPVGARFQNTGLPPYWSYCNAARQMRSVIMTTEDGTNFDALEWKRRIETFSSNDTPAIATGPNGQLDGVCNPGELTDKGRETTLALGKRLRHLYVKQLGFLPAVLSDPSMIYIRATPIPRALESVQQAFFGLYPSSARTATMALPTIILRAPGDETLFPNEGGCKRFARLSHAFAQRAADIWNDSPELAYLNKKIGKWMPENSPRVAVDGHPRLSGIMDTVNGTLAHGPETKLPKEFYDDKLREYMDKVVVDEWFAGYMESQEYRMLGIGGLVRDMTTRMLGSVEGTCDDGSGQVSKGEASPEPVRFCMSGAHDTTLAAVVASFGAFAKEKWPPFTSHLTLELFEKRNLPANPKPHGQTAGSWWSSFPLLGPAKVEQSQLPQKKYPDMTADEKAKLGEYYVRLRFNDRAMSIPGCKPAGKHFEGDESLCTLAAFKEIADKFAPRDWKAQCRERLDQPALPAVIEPAGW